jgi:hypothetical protein
MRWMPTQEAADAGDWEEGKTIRPVLSRLAIRMNLVNLLIEVSLWMGIMLWAWLAVYSRTQADDYCRNRPPSLLTIATTPDGRPGRPYGVPPPGRTDMPAALRQGAAVRVRRQAGPVRPSRIGWQVLLMLARDAECSPGDQTVQAGL